MTENNRALLSTVQAAGAVVYAVAFSVHEWAKGVALGLALYFVMSAVRHLLLAYKDGSIVERAR